MHAVTKVNSWFKKFKSPEVRMFSKLFWRELPMANQFCNETILFHSMELLTWDDDEVNVSEIGCKFLVMVATWFFTVWEPPRLHISWQIDIWQGEEDVWILASWNSLLWSALGNSDLRTTMGTSYGKNWCSAYLNSTLNHNSIFCPFTYNELLKNFA